MFKIFTSRGQHMGLPPGSLVALPDKTGHTAVPPKLTVMAYSDTELREEVVTDPAAALAQMASWHGITWLNVDGLGDLALLETIGKALTLHPLTLEDILTPDQRPKIDPCEGYLFVVVTMLSLSAKGTLQSEQVSMVLGKQHVVTFQQREGDVFGPIRTRLRNHQGRIRQAGADYLMYALLDAIIDHYYLVLEHYSDHLDTIDERVMTHSGPETLQSIHRLKQELAGVRRAAWPLRDLIAGIERSDSPLIHKTTRPYVRDLYDNIVHIIDTIEIFREMASGLLDVHLSVVSNRMNEIMKVLTLIATLFMPLTFIAGLYGMNFHYMPELSWHSGYFLVLGVMALTTIGMLTFFRRHRWL
jgi:magnesium transporter